MGDANIIDKRHQLRENLAKGLIGSAPVLLIAAYGASTGIAAEFSPAFHRDAAEHVMAVGEAQAEGEAEGEAEVDADAVMRPDDYHPYQGDPDELVAYGEELYANPALSRTGGISCMTCHAGGAQYQETFSDPYPHHVEMALSEFGIDRIHLDEMIQVCMVLPMGEDPLPWDSRELAALVEYYLQVEQPAFQEGK